MQSVAFRASTDTWPANRLPSLLKTLLLPLACLLLAATDAAGGHAANSLAAAVAATVSDSAFDRAYNGPSKVQLLEVGQRVALPCDIEALQDDSPLRISWFKDGHDTPNYIAEDVLRRGIWNGHHDISVAWAGRAVFMVLSDPAKLELSRLTIEDSGTYVCFVEFHRGDQKNTTSVIVVGVPPSVPTIRSTEGSVIRDKIGPLPEGANLTLVCAVEKGFPPPSIIWKKNGQMITKDRYLPKNKTNASALYQHESEEGARSVLQFGAVHRRDLLHTFTCEAENIFLTTPQMSKQPKRSVSVVLDLTLAPLAVRVTADTHPLNADTSSQFLCEVTGSRPPPVVRWALDGWNASMLDAFTFPELDAGQHLANGVAFPASSAAAGNGRHAGATRVVLVLPLRSEDNFKNLTCIAENPRIANRSWQDALQLLIHHLPLVRLSLGERLQADNIVEGSDVYLECSVRAHPAASDVFWSLDGRAVAANASLGIVADERFLVIRNITRRFSGLYTCTAINQRGPAASNVVPLSVKYAPRCSNEPRAATVVYSSLERPIEAECNVEAFPVDGLHFRWAVRNASTAQRPLSDFVTNGTRSTLQYRAGGYAEHSVLTCWANNSIGGMQSEPCSFHIEPKGVPPPLAGCRVANEVSRDGLPWQVSFHVVCADERLMAEIEDEVYLLQLYLAEPRTLLLNVTNSVPSFHISTVPEGAECIAEISAVNEQGKGDPLRLTIQNIPPPSRLLRSSSCRPESCTVSLTASR